MGTNLLAVSIRKDFGAIKGLNGGKGRYDFTELGSRERPI